MRSHRVVLLAAAAILGAAGPAGASGILPPANPPADYAFAPGQCHPAGGTPDVSPACVSGDVSQIDAARAQEGVGAMVLPTDYAQLTPAEQQFVVINLERVDRGLPPAVGLADQLDTLAAQGAGHGVDPPFPSGGITWGGSIWAGGFASTLEADEGWVYDDGPGSSNLDCTPTDTQGCWGHRDTILGNPAGNALVAGAAEAAGSWGPEYAMLLVQYSGPPPPLVYTWAQAASQGAGVVMTNPNVTRIAGADRIATAIAVSEATWPAGGSAGAAVIARADTYPDALAAVPLAASEDGPLLLTGPSALDPRTLTEIQRTLPPGAPVFLVGGTSALGPSVEAALAGAGYRVQRIAGIDRFDTAVRIADALGDPTTVLEVNGFDFADAVAAGPAAAAAHAAILLTAGTAQSAASASYLAAHHPLAYAVGGPAAAADPIAHRVAGADRYGTAAAVAGTFFPRPAVLGFATGLTYPDALAAGPQLAHDGGPLLLVAPTTPLPAATAQYVAGDSAVPALVYGGVAAVSDPVANLL